jgi:hypothetical protein
MLLNYRKYDESQYACHVVRGSFYKMTAKWKEMPYQDFSQHSSDFCGMVIFVFVLMREKE